MLPVRFGACTPFGALEALHILREPRLAQGRRRRRRRGRRGVEQPLELRNADAQPGILRVCLLQALLEALALRAELRHLGIERRRRLAVCSQRPGRLLCLASQPLQALIPRLGLGGAFPSGGRQRVVLCATPSWHSIVVIRAACWMAVHNPR